MFTTFLTTQHILNENKENHLTDFTIYTNWRLKDFSLPLNFGQLIWTNSIGSDQTELCLNCLSMVITFHWTKRIVQNKSWKSLFFRIAEESDYLGQTVLNMVIRFILISVLWFNCFLLSIRQQLYTLSVPKMIKLYMCNDIYTSKA